jgi:citryl-CoA lyase
MPDLKFNTQVSGEKDGIHFIRHYPLADLVAHSSFSAAVFYMVTGVMPDPHQERVLNAILVASLDHGLSPASGFVPRVVASTGNSIIHSMAAGLMALGPYHGGAIEAAAQVFVQVREKGPQSLEETHFSPQKRLPGFGHPHYKHTDPRADQLFAIAKEEGVGTRHQEVAYAVQQAIHERLDKHLVINIDGAIAAILLDLGFPAAAGNGLFALARCGGMIAHILEEYREKPVRRIDESEITFNPPSQVGGQQE